MNHRRVDPLRLIHPTFECRFMESPTLRFRVNFAKQLDICSAGSTTQTFRSDFQSTVIAARHWHANAACRTEAPDHHQYPMANTPASRPVLTNLAEFLSSLKATAEQLTDAQRLRAILSRAFAKFMLATVDPPLRLTPQFDII